MPRVLHSVNELVTESRTLPSAALGKGFFAECPTKSTRQSAEHSAKARIPVVFSSNVTPYLNLFIFFEDGKDCFCFE
jgi:hypothetical protein